VSAGPTRRRGAAHTPDAERQRRYRRGQLAEIAAAVFLVARGYRILARRFRVHSGEIDLIAVRGRLLAFVEVKRRSDEAALASAISGRQRQRIRSAADAFVARHPRYAEFDRRFDVVYLLAGSWPRHVEGGL
jgi:putative endonuclease